jgi:uncharacterized protein YraI
MTNRSKLGLVSLHLAWSAILATPVLAFPAFSTTMLNLRSGPGEEFPIIGVMERNVTVEVKGCLADWSWCAVNAAGIDGWVAGKYVVVNVQGGILHIAEVGDQGRVPVVGPDGVVIDPAD